MSITIWVDADACPTTIKTILYRAAERKSIPLILVANQALSYPRSPFIKSIQVGAGFDVADDAIVERAMPGDLVITADIPLAAEAIEKGALALNPRGEFYTKANIKARLDMRDFMDSLRGSGVNTGGPPPLNANDRKVFADNLDKFLAKT